MKNVLIAIILLSLCFGLACTRKTQPDVTTVASSESVTVSDVQFFSPAISDTLRYRMILPTIKSGEKLPVVYLLHGANSGPEEVMEKSEVVKLAVAEHLAVVMPDGRFSYYTNAKHKLNARWEDAITRDLRQEVLARFPVLAGREHTGIAGVSMGGYGAAKLSLKHPELYGFAGIMSGALDITRRPATLHRLGQTCRIWTIFGVRPSTRQDEDVFNILRNSPRLQQAIWFQSCGLNDPLYEVNERFAQNVRRRGVGLKLMTTQGGHDWTSWNIAMPQMLSSAGNALR